MNKNNFYIFFGVWIVLLPFTGIPGIWRNSLVSISGIFLILVTLGPDIFSKLNKPKIKRKPKVTISTTVNPDAPSVLESLTNKDINE